MRHAPLALAALLLAAAAPAPAELAPGAAVRDKALKSNAAYAIVEGLTTEIGQRLPGSAAEARAREWTAARMRALGFENVRIETFEMDGWEPGEERAEVLGPNPQRLAIAALGRSGATPPAGIEAEVVGFDSMEAFRAATAAQVKGRIVFITHRMQATQEGGHYGAFNAIRTRAPALASRLGAAAIVIRSLGTDYHRNPHTGVTLWTDSSAGTVGRPASEVTSATPIPAGALSLPDSEQLERLLQRGPVRLRLVLTPRFTGRVTSGNVIGEIRGSERPDEIVLIGGHLDSWHLGTGAVDDGAGVAITMAAAKLVAEQGRPKRTIRVVAWGAEEIGLAGGRAYAERYGKADHVLAAESDSGAGRVWRIDSRVSDAALPAVNALAQVLLPLGISRGNNTEGYGSDLGPLEPYGVPLLGLTQDMTGYFALHHTPDDTLDKIDRAELDQNVAAWAAMLAFVANTNTRFGPLPAPAPTR